MVWSTFYDVETTEKDFAYETIPKQLQATNAKCYLDYACDLDIQSPPSIIRLTGIICTIGPSSIDIEVLERMMECGMNIARINCSVADQAFQAEAIQNIRLAAENCSRRLGMNYPVAIALDLKGPEIRIGNFEGGIDAEVELKNGDQIKLTTDKAYFEKGSASVIYVDCEQIQKVVTVGNRLYIDDGLICLVCKNVQGCVLTCIVEVGGTLGSGRGVNIPGVHIDLPVIQEKDKEDLMFGLEHGVDLIFASFIRDPSAIAEIREMLGPAGKKLLVVAKIENQEGMQNIDAIIKAADGIMVGRGDLGIEIPLEKLFLAQKVIIAKCNKAGKPVICATQLLESMTKQPRPTRAECTDVANAVLDGADCVQLSTESARGLYVAESVLQMARICKEAEAAVWHRQHFVEIFSNVQPPIEARHAVAIAAVEAASKSLASAIIAITYSGKSAFFLSKYRPSCPIIAVTKDAQHARQMHLFRGVLPLVYTVDRLDDWNKDIEVKVDYGISFGKWRRFIRSGDPVVVTSGSRKSGGIADTLKILYVTKSPKSDELCDHVYNNV